MESQNYMKLILAARKVVETGSKDIYYENPHGDADSESSQVEEHQQALLSLENSLEEADDVIADLDDLRRVFGADKKDENEDPGECLASLNHSIGKGSIFCISLAFKSAPEFWHHNGEELDVTKEDVESGLHAFKFSAIVEGSDCDGVSSDPFLVPVFRKTVDDELEWLEKKHDLLWKEVNVFARWIEDIEEAAEFLGLKAIICQREVEEEYDNNTVSFELKDLDEGIIYLHIDNADEEVWWEITLVDAAGNERSCKEIAKEELKNLSTLQQAKFAIATAAKIFREQKGSKEMEDTPILLPELPEEELLSGLLVDGEENDKDDLAKHKEFFVTHQSNPLARTIPVPLESLGSPCMVKVEGSVKLTDGQYLSISAEDVEEIRLKDGGVLTAGKKMTVSFRAMMQMAQEITVTAPTKEEAINIAQEHLSEENWKPSPLVNFDKVHEEACSSADFRNVEEN